MEEIYLPSVKMTAPREVIRHALILVFEYRRAPNANDVPNPLLSMDTDLKLAYEMSRNRFQIPAQNITVVTDVKPRLGVMAAWDPLDRDPYKNPRIIRLNCPDITKVCREIAQFVENTVRGIREVPVTKGDGTLHEVFIYMSGHGAQIPNPHRHDDNSEPQDNALIFTTADGTSRRYLRDDHIFRILFGQVDVDENGIMAIPITNRQICRSKRDGSLYYNFSDEVVTFRVTPGVDEHKRLPLPNEYPDEEDIVAYTPSGRHVKYVKDRGLPPTTHMLALFDTCHSGTMTDFHYIYRDGYMELTRKPPTACKREAFPLCICLAAANDEQEAPSTSAGSPFTRHLYNIFNQLQGTVSIKEINDLIYDRLPPLLRKCRPTITATIDTANCLLPLLHTPGPVVSTPSILTSPEIACRSRSKSDGVSLKAPCAFDVDPPATPVSSPSGSPAARPFLIYTPGEKTGQALLPLPVEELHAVPGYVPALVAKWERTK